MFLSKKTAGILLNVIFGSVCILGWLWQTKEVSVIYFGYKTLTKLKIEIPQVISIPAVSICLKYSEILNLDSYRLRMSSRIDENLNFVSSNFSITTDDVNYDAPLTIAEIFDMSPSTEDTIGFCASRMSKNPFEFVMYGSWWKNLAKCKEIFNVTKYYYLDYMCYKYVNTELDGLKFNYGTISVSPLISSFLYGFNFNTNLTTANMLKVVLHESKDQLPYKSLMISSVEDRGLNATTGQARRNKFVSSFRVMTEDRLPAPYDSNCFNYSAIGFDSMIDCREECARNRTVDLMGKLPFSRIQKEPIEMKHISYIDLRVADTRKLINQIDRNCARKCRNTDCNKRIMMTETAVEMGNKQFEAFGIWILIPKSPYIKVTFSPIMSFVEFLTFCMSTLSTWVGLSIFDFNPHHVNKLWGKVKSGGLEQTSLKSKSGQDEDEDIKRLMSKTAKLGSRLKNIELMHPIYEERLKSMLKRQFDQKYGPIRPAY